MFEVLPKPNLHFLSKGRGPCAQVQHEPANLRETGMLAVEARTTVEKLGPGKEIKVKIPVGYHIKLHTLKVLKGQSISDTVEIALESYFEKHPFPEMPGRAIAVEATTQ